MGISGDRTATVLRQLFFETVKWRPFERLCLSKKVNGVEMCSRHKAGLADLLAKTGFCTAWFELTEPLLGAKCRRGRREQRDREIAAMY